MNISRHNYETFFLLYTDNELSVAERKAVDEFVEANPDLQEELVMLQQSILKPDDIVFDNKNSLLRNEFVSTGLQEKLLLRLDNELSSTEKNEIDGLIQSNGEIKKEWEILQQTKLTGKEVIVFKDKQSLYRREGGRVIAFPWKRVAAAAILIGFIIGGGSIYFNRGTQIKSSGNETVKIIPPTAVPEKIKPPVDQAIAPQVISPAVKDESVASVPVDNKKASTNSIIKSPKKVESRKVNKDDAQPLALKKTNNLPKPYSENLNKMSSNETVPAYVTTEKQATNIVNPGSNAIGKNTGENGSVNGYASTTAFIDNTEDNNNRVLFMNEEKIKKTKLGGIFRKVKRVFERNTNIKGSDNNIKVANLEFAIQ